MSKKNNKYFIIIFLYIFFINILPIQAKDTSPPESAKQAIFAAGCFWCIEKDFERHAGVYAVYSGYSGGTVKNPSYKQVSAGNTGHREVVQVWYDPNKLAYADLVEIFWRNVDPFDAKGQFCDKGFQYTGAIYFDTPEEAEIALSSKAAFEKRFGQPIATAIDPAATFYLAEDYHQDYYEKSPIRYKGYRYACGRDARLESVWGKEARAETLKSIIK